MELRQFVSLTSTVPNWLINARGVRKLCLRGAFASDGIDIKMILQSCHPYRHIPSTSRPLLDAFACARVASIRTFVESYVHSFLCLRGAFASDGIDSKTIQSCLPPTRLTTILNTGIVSSTTKKVAATQRLAGPYLTFSLVHVWCRSEHS